MNLKPTINTRADCLYLSGALDFSNVAALQKQGETWITHEAPARCRLDLSAVDYSNSAGIALILAWLRAATTANKKLQIEHIPANLTAIFRLSGLDQALNSLDLLNQSDPHNPLDIPSP